MWDNYSVKHDEQHRTIREATDHDQPAIDDINREAYASFRQRFGVPTYPPNDDAGGRKSDGPIFVAEQDNAVVGLLVLIYNADHVMLENIAVSPKFQGLGIGRDLLAFAEHRARLDHFGQIRLYTNSLTPENIRVYTRTGYQETHRIMAGAHEWVFMKKLLLEP